MANSRPNLWTVTAMLAVLTGVVVWAYFPVLSEMARKWVDNPQYSHGYIVPGFSLWLIWRRRNELLSCPGNTSWLGLIPLILGLGLRFAGAVYSVSWLEAISLIPTLLGSTLLLGGIEVLRLLWVPIAFLFFMIPLPYSVEMSLSHDLRRVATVLSTYALQVVGYPAFSEGNIIIINQTRVGVVDACNGLGMLLLFFALSAAVCILMPRRWLDRSLIMASAIPVAIAANVLRIFVTSILLEEFRYPWLEATLHDTAGLFMMPLALLMLLGELKLLYWILVEVPEQREDDPVFGGLTKPLLVPGEGRLPTQQELSQRSPV